MIVGLLLDRCPHFTIAHCEKWKSGCYECPQFGEYPAPGKL